MRLHDIVERAGRAERLDPIAERASKAVKQLIRPGAVKDVLSGTWLGHPVHPPLTDIPIGSFSSATLLDLIGGDRSRSAANTLVAIGIASAVPTALSGAADWSETYGPAKRIGAVHGAANAIGIALYAASLPHRRRGSRAVAASLGLTGLGIMSFAGHLGGSLIYREGVGVDNTAFDHPPEDWTPVLPAAHLHDGATRCADAAGVPVLLHRTRGAIHTIANRCSHAGGPLHEGPSTPRPGPSPARGTATSSRSATGAPSTGRPAHRSRPSTYVSATAPSRYAVDETQWWTRAPPGAARDRWGRTPHVAALSGGAATPPPGTSPTSATFRRRSLAQPATAVIADE